jgi:hypothetical protein
MDQIVFQSLLPTILLQIPVFLVMLAGVILALVYWQRNAKVSLLVIAALVLSFIVRIGSALQSMLLPFLINTRGWGFRQVGWLGGCLGIVWSVLSAVDLGLLLGAVFGWRKGSDAEAGDSEFADSA